MLLSTDGEKEIRKEVDNLIVNSLDNAKLIR